MRKPILGIVLLCMLTVFATSPIRAAEETADAVLSRAASTLAASDSVFVQAYQRDVSVYGRDLPGTPPGRGPGQVRSYSALILYKRLPNDWYLSVWTINKPPARTANSTVHAPVNPGFYMSKVGGGMGKLAEFGGETHKGVSQQNLTDDDFDRTLRTRLLRRGSAAFFPLEALLNNTNTPSGEARLFRGEARLVGVEQWNQREFYRIEGVNDMGGLNIVWVGKVSGRVERVITQLETGGPYRPVTETIYITDTGKKLAGNYFDADVPEGASETLTDEQMGFGPVEDLVKSIAPFDSARSVNSASPANPAAPKSEPPPVTAAPATPEQQALTTEQMEGIVLIEGDEGTATGFMTRIKDVDFVVTNQHVLGTNKRITLKNLHGEVVPVQGIYGAVGIDVAILKIAKAQGTLKLADDVLKSVKIGDKIVVVGNRLGGGVATQTSGQVIGVGPTRIEVNANFEPGNSGSPIFSTSTGEVIGVATYAESRKIDLEERGSASSGGAAGRVEKRWFGYRLDGVSKWEQINLEKWHTQGERIEKFRNLSEALVNFIQFDWKKAAANDQLATLIGDFQGKAAKIGSNRVGMADEVRTIIYKARNMAEGGIREFESAEYYDYYRSCLYWQENVAMQVEYRKAIVAVLKKYEANSGQYLNKMRNGSGT